METKRMRIGELAKRADVNIQTIRYYERRGILAEPVRLPSGYREYTEDCLRRMQFIRRAQGLGFTLSEIEDLLKLRGEDAGGAEQVRRKAEEKARGIEEKIRSLQELQREIRHLTGSCQAEEKVEECALLEAMGPSGESCTHNHKEPRRTRSSR